MKRGRPAATAAFFVRIRKCQTSQRGWQFDKINCYNPMKYEFEARKNGPLQVRTCKLPWKCLPFAFWKFKLHLCGTYMYNSHLVLPNESNLKSFVFIICILWALTCSGLSLDTCKNINTLSPKSRFSWQLTSYWHSHSFSCFKNCRLWSRKSSISDILMNRQHRMSNSSILLVRIRGELEKRRNLPRRL